MKYEILTRVILLLFILAAKISNYCEQEQNMEEIKGSGSLNLSQYCNICFCRKCLTKHYQMSAHPVSCRYSIKSLILFDIVWTVYHFAIYL